MRNLLASLFFLVGVGMVGSTANAYTLFQCLTYAKYLALTSECQTLTGPTITSAAVVRYNANGGSYYNRIDLNQGIGGQVTVEPRRGQYFQGNYNIFSIEVFFSQTITSVGSVRCVDSYGRNIGAIPCQAYFPGTQPYVQITTWGVPDGSNMRVIISDVNGAGREMSFGVGFLLGDVDGSGDVADADLEIINSQITQRTDISNFKSDINLSGSISLSDLGLASSRKGRVLKP